MPKEWTFSSILRVYASSNEYSAASQEWRQSAHYVLRTQNEVSTDFKFRWIGCWTDEKSELLSEKCEIWTIYPVHGATGSHSKYRHFHRHSWSRTDTFVVSTELGHCFWNVRIFGIFWIVSISFVIQFLFKLFIDFFYILFFSWYFFCYFTFHFWKSQFLFYLFYSFFKFWIFVLFGLNWNNIWDLKKTFILKTEIFHLKMLININLWINFYNTI